MLIQRQVVSPEIIDIQAAVRELSRLYLYSYVQTQVVVIKENEAMGLRGKEAMRLRGKEGAFVGRGRRRGDVIIFYCLKNSKTK